MFAATLFTIVSIFVKCESVIASANVGADSIATFLLAAAVVHCAFIFVYSHIKKQLLILQCQENEKVN